ncbi:MAG: M61 family metallopeptidase [Leptothrix sp. (in: b-proteobacteria)]
MASTSARAAAAAPPGVRYQVELADLSAHQYRVTLTLDRPAAQQVLSLPVWIPGSYLVREFARHLSALTARQGSRTVALVALDKQRWQADCSGRGALVVSYLVYAFDASVRTAWLDSERGFFNATSLCLAAESRESEPHQISLGKLPAGWQVATGLPKLDKTQAGPSTWLAPSYDALIDHPFELGPFWRGQFNACGVPHEFVVAGAPPGFDGARLLADAQRICEAQIRFWHGDDPAQNPPPFERYVFMLAAVDDGYGGLEHRNSTALICNRRDLPRHPPASAHAAATPAPLSDGYVTLLGLISHEYFHTWNVKRLKPAEFSPYDLSRENPTELLWFFEGFTSYYDDLFLLRAGLIDAARHQRLLAKTINQVLGTPGRWVQSVAQASFDAWLKYYRPDENSANATVSYYTKGALVGLALDLTLRGEGRGSLDAVMRRLWQVGHADDGLGAITEADIADALQHVGKRAYDAELARWVHGTDDLPLAELLASIGLVWRREAPTLAQRLGARVTEAPAGLKVQAVLRGGAAEQAGLAAGDELIALGGWRLAKLDDLPLYGAFEQPLALLASRDRRLLHLTLPAAAAASVDGAVSLTLDAKPSAAVARRRRAWLAASRA